jgi:glyoxylase-like metal-dependent hydrolase (beta-lactamase superfamily II)
MRINRTGKVSNRFYVLGHAAVPVYLLDGPVPVLFDAGFTSLSRVYEREIGKILERRSPGFLFLTHAHWDHIGSAAYFKSLWPNIRIACSSLGQKILARPGAIEQIRVLNREAIAVVRTWGVDEIHKGRFEPFNPDIVLDPGQTIKVGPNLSIQAIPTPGHTWDSFSYWVPERKILIAAEAAGCDGVCEFLVDYDVYRNSLEAISRLDVEILCSGHNLVLTGSDVKKYIRQSLDHAIEYVDTVERFLREEGGDIARTIARVKAAEWDPKPLPKQPEKAYLMNTEARVKTLLERMRRVAEVAE